MKVNTGPADRLGLYFRKEVTINNSTSAVWQGLNLEFTLSGAGVGGGDIVTQRSGHHYVAPATSSPTYDEDGNLTSDSRWTYTWDGENRLVSMESTTTALSAGVPKRRLEFLYDGQSRRISKKVMDWHAATNAWVTKDERRFVYDGWNLVAELNASGNLIQSHTWGMDLSGTAQGAGGVGGLLWSNDVANTQVLFAAYDGNGNVVAMISTSENPAKVKARYDYNAFGETVLQEGDVTLSSNSYRFSTKYQDEETGLYYYGYRYYEPATCRWLSRDPIEEKGGVNLYGFVGNDAANKWDYLGLDFIAVGISGLGSFGYNDSSGPSRHLSLEYYKSLCPAGGFNARWSTEAWYDHANRSGGRSAINDQFELMNDRNWTGVELQATALHPGAYPMYNYRKVDVWISVILRTSQATSFVVLYEDKKPERVKKRWEQMIRMINGYDYAEKGLFGRTAFGLNENFDLGDGYIFKNYPNSLYSALGNNSNTFVKYIVKNSGFNMPSNVGWVAGNDFPERVLHAPSGLKHK